MAENRSVPRACHSLPKGSVYTIAGDDSSDSVTTTRGIGDRTPDSSLGLETSLAGSRPRPLSDRVARVRGSQRVMRRCRTSVACGEPGET